MLLLLHACCCFVRHHQRQQQLCLLTAALSQCLPAVHRSPPATQHLRLSVRLLAVLTTLLLLCGDCLTAAVLLGPSPGQLAVGHRASPAVSGS